MIMTETLFGGQLALYAQPTGLTAVQWLPSGPIPGEPMAMASASPEETTELLASATRQLQLYFSGRLRQFDLPLAPAGTPFQLAVWTALRQIPYGTTVSYQTVAERIGRPLAARAVGQAIHRNPLPIIIPCHRVIAKDGRVHGFAWGTAWKQSLLQLEAVGSAQPAKTPSA